MPRVRKRAIPWTTRSRLMLEVASELVGYEDWPYPQARISLREQGSDSWPVSLFASDTPAGIEEVAQGRAQVAIINPGAILGLALRGRGPFKEPIPLTAIAVIPSHDQLVFAVTGESGLTSLDDIRKRQFPLKVSLRGQRDHSVHLVINEVLSAAGFSLDDIVAWGGEVRYDPYIPHDPRIPPGGPASPSVTPGRIGAVERGEIHAIFDEAINAWAGPALKLGMRFLPLEESLLQHLEGLGFRRGFVDQAPYPQLSEDVPTLDFSGFPIYTHANAPDQLVTDFCTALETRKDRIAWQGEGPLPLERMVRDTPEGPLDIPLHPAAERFWQERGYL